MEQPRPSILLFDIGGVLVNWDGIAPLIALAHGQLTAEEARKFWLESPSVRKFEAGFCNPDQFAAGVVEELRLDCTPQHFLEQFITWDRGPLPGAVDLLHELKVQFRLDCLSNNNELHWRKLAQYPGFLEQFEMKFVSYEVHLVKPDPDIFHYVLEHLDVPAPQILFFDDNIECVEEARRCGLPSCQARGVEGVINAMTALGLRGQR